MSTVAISLHKGVSKVWNKSVSMLNIRVTLFALIVWLAIVCNIERQYEFLNISSIVYIVIGLVSALLVLLPKIRRVKLVEVLGLVLPGFLALKALLGYRILGDSWVLTFIESFALTVSIALSWRISEQIDGFLKKAAEIVSVDSTIQNLSMKICEPKLYAEVQRARRFGRPISLAVMQFDKIGESHLWESLTQQARDQIAVQYLRARMAVVLSEHMQAGDILASLGSKFIVMFPERDRRETLESLACLAGVVRSQIGVDLRYGLAEFPGEECTLTGLISKADQDCMCGDQQNSPTCDCGSLSRSA